MNKIFSKTYQFYLRAIKNKNETGSKKYLDKLKTYKNMTLVDDAFLNIAEYQYQSLLGDEEAQLHFLTRAVGSSSQYVLFSNKAYYLYELLNLFKLQIKFNYFEEADDTYSIITKINDDAAFELLTQLEPYIKIIEDIKTNDTSYQTKAKTNQNGIWHIGLLKPEFTITDIEGQIQEVKLRCTRKYVFFEYIKDRLYHIPKSYGDCQATLIGDPDTSFNFVQLANSK